MSRAVQQNLEKWLTGGERQIGQVLIRVLTGSDGEENRYHLSHVDDRGLYDLRVERDPNAARQIALNTEAEEFRPLKTAPNLRRGWRLELVGLAELRTALDLLYPAMLGILRDHEAGELPIVPLRGILGRQSGMYAVTKKLTDDQAQGLVGGFCKSDGGCLKTILWPIDPGVPIGSLPTTKFDLAVQQYSVSLAPSLPMLCHEACNLLVAKAREVVKASLPK